MEELPGEDRLQARDEIFDAAGTEMKLMRAKYSLHTYSLPALSTSFAIGQKMAFPIVLERPFQVNGGKG